VYRDDTSSEVPPGPIVGPPINWSNQLTEFLATVSSAEDERTASRVAVERAAETFGALAAALVREGEVVASAGARRDGALMSAMAEVEGESTQLSVPGLVDCAALATGVGDNPPSTLVIARAGAGSFALHELHLARGMARVLGLSLRLFRLAAEERRQRREAETQSKLNQRLLDSLQERQELLERLARIQRSITHGAVREDVLEAICQGACELLGDEVAGLQLVTSDDEDVVELVAMTGRDADALRGGRTPRTEGISGRAITNSRLVVAEDYQGDANSSQIFRERGIRAAMSAPVHEHGRVIGSLTVASYQPGRRYSSIERDMLIAFADHASLALSDSRSIQAMREADAARMQARFRSLVNSSSDMITVIDSAGEIAYVSPSVERTLAPPYGGFEGAPLSLLIHPEDRRLATDFLSDVALDSAASKPVEWRMRAVDGSWVDVETNATGQLDDPDLQGIVLNSREVTERKRLEAQLRQSQRLESVGQLAGGIAHDFNNFLSVIQGYARFLVDGLEKSDPLRSDAEEIERAADRAARLTSQLLVFSRHEVVPRTAVDVAEVLDGISSILVRTLGEDVELHTDVARPLNRVEADPTQIEQVLVNLAVNARDAMRSGGELHIGLANVEENGPALRLTVRDTGHGMAPQVVERAFEPFYSTKPKNEGTGLGLATVYGIVTQAGGSIEIHSTPGEGTTVEVLLPATGAAPDQAPMAARPVDANGSGETILVVEDEAAVRRLTCRILAREGYNVLEAPDGAGAISAWDSHAGAIDLVLTDVVMPGMSGKELAERLGIEPVFMSGYTDDVMLRHGVEGLRLVQKPFDAQTLLGAVRSALAA
jgi:PAS domain S-box-containing protein